MSYLYGKSVERLKTSACVLFKTHLLADKDSAPWNHTNFPIVGHVIRHNYVQMDDLLIRALK